MHFVKDNDKIRISGISKSIYGFSGGLTGGDRIRDLLKFSGLMQNF